MQYLKQYGERLVELGYRIVPLPPGSKGPKRKGWPQMHADAAQPAADNAPQAPSAGSVPVAWRAASLSGSGELWAYRDADDWFEDKHGRLVGEPLYAAPQANAQTLSAMTDDEIVQLFHPPGVVPPTDRQKVILIAMARAILQANGAAK